MSHFPWLLEFSHLTFSHRLGIAKPDAAIYLYAAKGLGVTPENVLFLDDREENVAGARAVGMMAIQYGRHDEFVKTMQREGLGGLLSLAEGSGSR
jgi:putative hydrolase of the HAD superfamily